MLLALYALSNKKWTHTLQIQLLLDAHFSSCRWVEFTEKRAAKKIANMLNGEQIGTVWSFVGWIPTFYFCFDANDVSPLFILETCSSLFIYLFLFSFGYFHSMQFVVFIPLLPCICLSVCASCCFFAVIFLLFHSSHVFQRKIYLNLLFLFFCEALFYFMLLWLML